MCLLFTHPSGQTLLLFIGRARCVRERVKVSHWQICFHQNTISSVPLVLGKMEMGWWLMGGLCRCLRQCRQRSLLYSRHHRPRWGWLILVQSSSFNRASHWRRPNKSNFYLNLSACGWVSTTATDGIGGGGGVTVQCVIWEMAMCSSFASLLQRHFCPTPPSQVVC